MTKDTSKLTTQTAKTFFYRLNPACERGKQFLQVVGEGVNAEREADKLVKQYKAVGCIPNMYADFGGVQAFAFKATDKPDEELFLDCEQHSKEGYALYEPKVKAEQRVCLWENMPADDPFIIKAKRSFTLKELLGNLPRKMIARALGIELKYVHPVEALRLLGVNPKKIESFTKGEMSIREVLAGYMFIKKREKQLMQFAIEGDKEERAFIAQAKDYTYGIYSILRGSPKAVAMFCDIQALPVVPHGALNHIVGLDKARNRCGFFTHENWIWVKSSEESTLEVSDDWQVVKRSVWENACKEARLLYAKREYKKAKKE